MNNEASAELVINELLRQVAELSKKSAINVAVATQYKQELDELKKDDKPNAKK